jgi:hypothetical protein
MCNMFATPAAPGAGIKWESVKGSLLLIDVKGFQAGIQTAYGTSDAVEADIHVIDGNGKGESYEQTLIFPKLLISQTKSAVGQRVLGRLGQGQAKSGQSAPWLLEEASAADVQLAEQWVKNNQPTVQAPAAPF